MDGATLPASFAKVERQWAAIRELLETDDLWALRKPEVSGWSCGEHGAHLVIVAGWIAREITASLADARRNEHRHPTDVGRQVLATGAIVRGLVQSPAQVRPGGAPREEYLAALTPVVDAWRTLRDRSAEIETCPARFAHFALGYLDGGEWARFAAVHTAHHLAIVRDIRARP